MVRETKSQRLAREERFRVECEEVRRRTYPLRMMTVFARAKPFFELEVEDSQCMVFVLTSRTNPHNKHFVPLEYKTADYNLENLEVEVEYEEELDKEAERKYLLKKTAFAKLTEEEREVLGVK